MQCIQGNLGTKGNFELVMRRGRSLVHFWRDNDDPTVFPWFKSIGFGRDVSSEPALIQSNIGNQGNFEVVVREGRKLRHYYRNNDAASLKWKKGALFGSNVNSAPALIQSSYGSRGNFEVVVREGRKLRHYWRDNDSPDLPWHRGALFGENAYRSPALIQSNHGFIGNFEVLVPEGAAPRTRLRHYWRDNDAPGTPWRKGDLFGSHISSAPVLIQSNFGFYGNFEVAVREKEGLRHYWRDNDAPKFPWHRGVVIADHITAAPSLIQGNFGRKGNFELLTQRGNCLVHFWRKNGAPDFPWSREVFLHAEVPLGSNPSPHKEAQFLGYFPNLRNWKITAHANSTYNCVSWSVGITDQWIWPGDTVPDFDKFYASHGWLPSAHGRREYRKRKVALWADDRGCTHGSLVTYDCEWNESKCGSLDRIMHDKYQMEGGVYGRIIKYYEKFDAGANLDLA